MTHNCPSQQYYVNAWKQQDLTANLLSFSYAKPAVQHRRGLDFCNGGIRENGFVEMEGFCDDADEKHDDCRC
jgi:hypothetical protein